MYLTCLQSFYTPPLRSPVVHVDSQVSCRQPKSKTMRLLYHCNNWDSFPCVFIFTTHAWWFQVLLWCLFSLLFQLTKLLPFYLYNHSGICFWRLMFCSKLCKLSLTMLISIYLIITLLVKKKNIQFHYVHCISTVLPYYLFVFYYGAVLSAFTKSTPPFDITIISVLTAVIVLCQLLTSVDWSVVCPLRADLAVGWVFETFWKCYINSDGFELERKLTEAILRIW